MHARLCNFFEDHDILHPLQFGFRSKHSTLHALIGLTESIKKTIDDGMFGCGVFIDLQKAFDTVNHSILLKKMEHYGVRGIALDQFTSYLSDMKQYVSVNGYTSDYLNISCGVPQGSVLGTLLFLIYIMIYLMFPSFSLSIFLLMIQTFTSNLMTLHIHKKL